MSLEWVERIPDPPIEDIVKSAIGIETEGYTHQLQFYYPKKGGIGALIRSLVDKDANLKTDFRVSRVKRVKGEWQVSNGAEVIHGNKLVTTMPIFELIKTLEKIPKEVVDSVNALQYNSLILVMIGLRNEGLTQRTALYIPDPKILPHRVCFPKYFSQHNAPKGCSHLVAEITVPPNDPLLRVTDGLLIERVFGEMRNLFELEPNDVISTEVKRIKYGYVVYDKNYKDNTKIIFEYLNKNSIYYAGRFGSFEYINMDACVLMAKELAERLK